MATIYRKTPKGHTEIETRALRLLPRLRSALILVDGRRSDAELHRMILQQPEETLRSLDEQGFIEAISITAAVAPPRQNPLPHAVPAALPAASAPAIAAPPSAPSMPARSFEALRADLVRSFTDSIGPPSETLAIKMERARSTGELRPLAETAQRIIGNARGGQAASDFGAKFIGLLGG